MLESNALCLADRQKTHNIPVDKLYVFKVQYDLSASLHLFLQLLDVFRLNSTTIKG